MVYDAIASMPPDQQPTGDIAISWALSADRTRYRFHEQERVLNSITSRAHEAGLQWVVLKGMSLARYYPNPSSRACGDIDLFFPGHYAEANILLGNPEATVDGIHSEIRVDGVMVENHVSILNSYHRSLRLAEQYIHSTLKDLTPEGYLSPMGNMVYLLMHTVHHLTAKDKVPLRNLVDWGMFLRANTATLQPEECHRVMRHIGMVPAFNILTYLAGDFIGFDLGRYIIGRVRTTDAARMRELILTRQYLAPVPKGLPPIKYVIARLRRNRARRWIFPYLTSNAGERLMAIIRRETGMLHQEAAQ